MSRLHGLQAPQLIVRLIRLLRAEELCAEGEPSAVPTAEAEAVQPPTPAATALISASSAQPGQSWLHFKLDRGSIMASLDAALAAAGPAGLVH